MSGLEITLAPGDGRIGVGRVRAPAELSFDGPAWLVVDGGDGRLRVGAGDVDVVGRSDVFRAAGWSALAAAGTPIVVEGDLVLTVVWRPGDHALADRLIPPDEVAEEERGAELDGRLVRTYVAEGPIIAGETLNRPGRWSSWPPHRHEHEEVYVYRFDPPHGFGLAVNYDDDADGVRLVRDGDVQRIASGYHPVVAAPDCAMYYLWALAGEQPTLSPEVDPAHAAAAR